MTSPEHFASFPARVLIVEDDKPYAEMLRASLNSAAIKIVAVAYDARTGLTMWQDLNPDALITDLALPGPYSGVDLIGEIRHRAPDAIIIALTGTDDQNLAKEAAAAGAQAVFRKQDYPPVRDDISTAITERNGVTYE